MVSSFYKTAVYILLVLLSYNAFGQSKISKEIKQTHALSSNGSLSIDNKYGSIFIYGWEKNEIQITVNIEAQRREMSAAKELLDRINPNIVATHKQVIIKSEIAEKTTSLFNRYFNKIDPFKNEKASTAINYEIYLPINAAIEISNKYGDIIISDWNGKLTAKVEHGDIRLTDSITNSNLTINYGKIRANTLNKSHIVAKDASVSISNANTLKLDSHGTEIMLGKINKLELYSNKDTIEIEELNTIFGTVKYSNIVIDNINHKINLDLNLAELKLMKLSSSSPFVDINQKSSEVYMNISDTNFDFNAKLEQGVLRIPKTMKNISSDVIDEKNKIRNIKATYGENKKGYVSFTGIKGIIFLKEL